MILVRGCVPATAARSALVVSSPATGRELVEAVGATDFLYERVYGRSRVPSLSALLQRQFRPTPPLPFRRDSLLITAPEWFESRAFELISAVQPWYDELQREVAAAALGVDGPAAAPEAD